MSPSDIAAARNSGYGWSRSWWTRGPMQRTCIRATMPEIGVPFDLLEGSVTSRGIGGRATYFPEPAIPSFTDYATRQRYGYRISVNIAKPGDVGDGLPSLLGRNVPGPQRYPSLADGLRPHGRQAGVHRAGRGFRAGHRITVTAHSWAGAEARQKERHAICQCLAP